MPHAGCGKSGTAARCLCRRPWTPNSRRRWLRFLRAQPGIEVIHEPEELTRELRRMAVLGVAGRFAAAVGVSALVALFFVVMIPASRSPDGFSLSTAGIIESIKASLPQSVAKDDAPQPAPAASELQTLLTSTPNHEPVTREQSEQLLEQFVQWQTKPAPKPAP